MAIGKPIIEDWLRGILANPATKIPCSAEDFPVIEGISDARIFLRNTYGFSVWLEGQEAYEKWEEDGLPTHIKDTNGKIIKDQVQAFNYEIDYDRPTYSHFVLQGKVLDVGGAAGTLRQFLSPNTKYVSIDPNLRAPLNVSSQKAEAYTCLKNDFSFLAAMAEFLPFREKSFDFVHMRSMLDHVQIPDLALIEAHRVLVDNGALLVGISIEGGREGHETIEEKSKEIVRAILGKLGIKKWQDHHIWHPTLSNLRKLIESNGYKIEEIYWQPKFENRVVYVKAIRI